MPHSGIRHAMIALALLSVVLGGCGLLPPHFTQPAPAPAPVPPEILTVQSQRDLKFALGQYQAGRYEVAGYYLRKALIQSPDNPDALTLLPWAYFFQKKYDQAGLAFANALAHFPRDPRPLVGLGWIYVTQQLYEKALDAFERAEALAGPNFQTRKGIAFCHLFLKQTEAAEKVLGEIYSYQETTEVLRQWDRWREAMPGTLPEIAPSDPEALSLFTLSAEAPRFVSILYSHPDYQPHPGLDRVWELFAAQRYALALSTLESLPPDVISRLDARNAAAWALLESGDLNAAAQLFRQLNQDHPGFPGVRRGLSAVHETYQRKARFAQYYFDIGKFRIARNEFARLQESYPDWSHPWSMLGWVQLKRGQNEAALPLFKRALRLDPEDPKAQEGIRKIEGLAVAHLFKGDEALAQKRFKEASYHYFDFIDEQGEQPVLTPPLAQAYAGLGFSQIGKGQYRMALRNFEKLSGAARYQAEYHRGMGLAHYHLGNFEEAARYLITADSLAPGHPDVAYPLDWSVLRSWDRATARDYFLGKTRHRPRLASPYMALGWIDYKHGDPDRGVEFFLKALALDPAISSSEGFSDVLEYERFGWQIYNRLGWHYYGQREYPSALEMFQTALKRRPRSSEAMKGLGYTYYRLGKFDEAESILTRCIKRNPETHPVTERLASDEPGVEFPLKTSAATTLGRILYRKKRYQDALTPFLSELERHPDWVEVHEGLGWIYLQLNRLTESRDAFQEAIRRQPLHSTAHQGLREVKRRLILEKL